MLPLRRLLVVPLTLLVASVTFECATPTALTVTIYSEVPCATGSSVALVGGVSLSELPQQVPSSVSTTCDAEGRLGSVVIVPAGAKDETVAFAFMQRSDGQPADACLDPMQAAGCIVAKRQLRFERHDESDMRVDLRLSCLGVLCSPEQTCVRGACLDAQTSCGSSCDEGALSSSTDAGMDASVVDARPPIDATMDATPPMDATMDTLSSVDTGAAADAAADTSADDDASSSLSGTPTGALPIKASSRLFDPTTTVGGQGCPFLSGLDGAWRWTVSVIDGKISFAVPCKQMDPGNWPQILLLQYDPTSATPLSIVDAEPSSPGIQGVVEGVENMSDGVTKPGSVKTTFLAQATTGSVLIIAQGYMAGTFDTIPGIAPSLAGVNTSILNASRISATDPPGPATFRADNIALFWDPKTAQFVRLNEMHPASGLPYLTISTSADGVTWLHDTTPALSGFSSPHVYGYVPPTLPVRVYHLIAFDETLMTWVHIPSMVDDSPFVWNLAAKMVLHLEALKGAPGEWDNTFFDVVHTGQPTIAGFAQNGAKVYGFYHAGQFGAGGTEFGTSEGVGAFELPVAP